LFGFSQAKSLRHNTSYICAGLQQTKRTRDEIEY